MITSFTRYCHKGNWSVGCGLGNLVFIELATVHLLVVFASQPALLLNAQQPLIDIVDRGQNGTLHRCAVHKEALDQALARSWPCRQPESCPHAPVSSIPIRNLNCHLHVSPPSSSPCGVGAAGSGIQWVGLYVTYSSKLHDSTSPPVQSPSANPAL